MPPSVVDPDPNSTAVPKSANGSDRVAELTDALSRLEYLQNNINFLRPTIPTIINSIAELRVGDAENGMRLETAKAAAAKAFENLEALKKAYADEEMVRILKMGEGEH